jgi:hypothetical protein
LTWFDQTGRKLGVVGEADESAAGADACRLLCYNAFMRAGKTRTTSFSLDDVTLANLKALSLRRHRGNVSAFLAEIANREAKFAAAEAFFEKYGVPPLDEKDIAAIEAEWRSKRHRRRSRP